MNNDFGHLLGDLPMISLVTLSLVKIIDKSPHSWSKIIIHSNSYIITYFLHTVSCQSWNKISEWHLLCEYDIVLWYIQFGQNATHLSDGGEDDDLLFRYFPLCNT